MQWIKRAWLGKEKLSTVFWLYLCAPNILTVVEFVNILPNEFAGLLVLFFFFHAIWGVVALWKCSFNTNRRFWGYAARVAFVLGLAYEVITFYSGIPIGHGICTNQYPLESVCTASVNR